MISSRAILESAFSPDPPGAPLPPGPRANLWPGEPVDPVEVGGAPATAVHRLWRARGHHPRPDGTLTSVPRRAVPSAGAAYPVQWHLVVPPGHGGHLGPGRYVYLPASEQFVRRLEPRVPARPGPVEVVLTVQPGRTFGRYRHRAWPLWVADAAYALEALLLLIPDAHLPADWSDLAAVRRALDLPRAAQTAWWLERGLVPEIALARIRLPLAPYLDEVASAAISSRRSPAPELFQQRRRFQGTASQDVAEVARQSGQSWVLGADRVLGWARPAGLDAGGYARLWQLHREAARHTYSLNARGHGVRGVSGFCTPPAGSPPLVHALAILENGADG
ncbi:hypothetical protein ACFV9G_06160 [Nocardioides sp. NPDC059952]|uniref:hypothetical protein n=1 Tax=Nocardioides sp. NPDC059952 TaxID=3347014 RepID=UPI003667874E